MKFSSLITKFISKQVVLLHSPAWDKMLEQDVFIKLILLHTVMSQQTQNLPLRTTAVMLTKGWGAAN